MLTFAELLARFDHPRKTGKEFRTRCPAHDDTTPSLDISQGRDAPVFRCRSHGCATVDILRAVGLTWADVLPPRTNGSGDNIAALYDYCDAAGVCRYQVVRFNTTPKTFKHRHLDSAGEWAWTSKGIDKLPYRLNQLSGHARVFVCEGEKDVDRLWSLGLPATCNTSGAKNWKASDTAHLKAAGVQRCILLTDNDDEGRAHVTSVSASLTDGGILSLILPPFDGLPLKGDVSDWFNLGHTVAELEALILEHSAEKPAFPKLRGVDAMLQEPEGVIKWVVEDRIPSGSVCLLVAKPKVGKTTAARHLAVSVARGDDWLGFRCEQGVAWYLAFEGQERDHKAHFRQFNITPEDNDRLRCYVGPMTPDVMGWMRAEAKIHPPTLIIIDTFQRFVQVKSTDDYAEVTKAFDPLIAFTRETGAALLLIHHAGKSIDRDPLDSVLGSTAIAGSVDNTLVLAKLSGFRTITTRQRIGPDLDERVIQLTDTGRVVIGGSRQEAELGVLVAKMREALTNAGEPLSGSQWLELVEGRRQMKLKALRQLLTDGTITRGGNGKSHNPYVYSVVPLVPLVPLVPSGSQLVPDDIFEI